MAIYFPNFATAEQCQAIIERAKINLKPSALALRKVETAENTKGTRTSSGTFVSASEESTGALEFVERKSASGTMIPRSHGESFNNLAKSMIPTTMFSIQQSTDDNQAKGTVLTWALDTITIGLKVKPRKGDGLLFYSVHPNGTIDQTSLHWSCPVIKGEKWVATKWIKDQDQDE